MARKYKAKERQYFLRMFSSGVWYFLLRVSYDKHCNCMRPVWWPEHMQGISRPYVYKTLTGARNAQSSYVPGGAGVLSEIKELKENDAKTRDKSA